MVQSSYVAIPNENFGIFLYQSIIDVWQKSGAAITATQTPHTLDFRGLQMPNAGLPAFAHL